MRVWINTRLALRSRVSLAVVRAADPDEILGDNPLVEGVESHPLRNFELVPVSPIIRLGNVSELYLDGASPTARAGFSLADKSNVCNITCYDGDIRTSLQHWRKRHNLTQVHAAVLLCVSQPYLSLLEGGARPLTAALRSRIRAMHRTGNADSADARFWAQLSALGYPGFAHVSPSRARPRPDAMLLSVLAKPDVDSRVVEALPWLVCRYSGQMDLAWLVRQGKLQNLQNRLGFILEAAVKKAPELSEAVEELRRARMLQEATLGWDSMPASTREWMRTNRPPLAEHWNVLTKLGPDDLDAVA